MRCKLLSFAMALVALLPGGAWGHAERPSQFPSGNGQVPTYRTSGPSLVVCKPDSLTRTSDFPPHEQAYNRELFHRCAFQHLQAAIDAVTTRGTRILVMPGVYREEPSRVAPTAECAALLSKSAPYSYEEQVRCRHNQNLIAILGDGPDEGIACDGPLCELQIEGTGIRPTDVVLEGDFTRLNVLRADRADGVYLRNFAAQHATFNAVYVLETDGFVLDRLVGRWNDEYGFLTFSSDHGLYEYCEAYGNGDSGLYPGSAADLHGTRPSIEIRFCNSHHNLLGYSGTAGNSVYVHDNAFHHNAAGISTDSTFPDHPGLPQDSATFVRNRIYSNNEDYYRYLRDGTCDKPHSERGIDQGVVCPAVPIPVGTGIIIAGGNANLIANNHFWDNWRYGAMLFSVPAIVRNETDPTKQFDTSHFNRYMNNVMGRSPSGQVARNGLDFWWDEGGAGNCWDGNVAGSGAVTSDPATLPACPGSPLALPSNPLKQVPLTPCSFFRRDDPAWRDPPGCPWTHEAPQAPSP